MGAADVPLDQELDSLRWLETHISHRRTVTNQDVDDSRDGDDDDVPSVSEAGCSTEGSSSTCLSTTDVMSSDVSYFLIPSIC